MYKSIPILTNFCLVTLMSALGLGCGNSGKAKVADGSVEILDVGGMDSQVSVDMGSLSDAKGDAAPACITLHGTISKDLALSASDCVLLGRATLATGVTLTLGPGTLVKVQPEGYLKVNGTLLAVGDATSPITFTSAAASPLPGDWQCIRMDAGGGGSELRYVTLKYGGQPCDATGADYEAALDLAVSVRAVENVTISDSKTHGVLIQADANVRGFMNNHFARNGAASIRVSAKELLTLGSGHTFEDTDEFIDVDTTFGIRSTGIWTKQAVPFRLSGNLGITQATVTLGPGLVVQLAGTIDGTLGTLNIEGTAAEPVRLTSSRPSPLPGDWGCVWLGSTSVVDHAVIEYAGSGAGCTGAKHKTALYASPSTRITNTKFQSVAGSAVGAIGDCATVAWCTSNTFTHVAGPNVFACTQNSLVACP